MCHLHWKIVGLIHSQVIPSYVVYILFMLFGCVETFVVPLVYTLAWIIKQPVFGNSTWCWYHRSTFLPIPLTLDNSLGWSVSGVLHVACRHIWLQNSQTPMGMLLVSTFSSIGMGCSCKVHTLWVPIVIPVDDWRGYPPVGGRTFPSGFYSIHICCVLCSWGYILLWPPMVGYQLELLCTCINSMVFPGRFFKCHITCTLPLVLKFYCWWRAWT